jgi:hypothetical protein
MTKKKTEKNEHEEKKEQIPEIVAKPIVEHNKAWRVANGIQEK